MTIKKTMRCSFFGCSRSNRATNGAVFVKLLDIKKSIFAMLIAAIFVLQFAAAITIEKKDKGADVLVGLNNPALFDLIINNTIAEDSVEIYALAGMVVQPRGPIDLPIGQTILELKAYPNNFLREQRGTYNFEYQIKSKNTGVIADELTISIVELKDSLEFKVDEIKLNDAEAKITIKNSKNAFIDGFRINFNSVLFSEEKVLSLAPHEEKIVSIPINNKNAGEIVAGSYVLTAEVAAGNAKTKFEVPFKYVQKEDIVTNTKKKGIIFKTTTVEKINTGNVLVQAKIEIKKDVFSRLFTVNSIEPASVDRNGLVVDYIWEKEIKPSESFIITARTNYTFPFILVLLIVIIALLVYGYSKTSVVVSKRVSYVKTKGGEFALKVKIHVKAKKYVEDLQVIDKLPGMAILYEKFGIKPDKIDAATRRLFWNIERLNAGEERVFSYIIYSKVRVVGRFELPPATAIFDREGKTHEVLSNRTFFVSDIARSED